jgi:hypothetical protein
LYWGKYEATLYPETTQSWATPEALVAAGEWGAIYQLPATR